MQHFFICVKRANEHSHTCMFHNGGILCSWPHQIPSLMIFQIYCKPFCFRPFLRLDLINYGVILVLHYIQNSIFVSFIIHLAAFLNENLKLETEQRSAFSDHRCRSERKHKYSQKQIHSKLASSSLVPSGCVLNPNFISHSLAQNMAEIPLCPCQRALFTSL